MPHRRRETGSALPLLLVALGLLLGAGAWNYHRNWKAEQAQPRPYRHYDEAQLDALIEAYEQETTALEERASAAPRVRADAPDGALLGERVAAFDRARRAGEAQRRLADRARRHDAVLEALRAERALRAEAGAGLALHWRRLTGL